MTIAEYGIGPTTARYDAEYDDCTLIVNGAMANTLFDLLHAARRIRAGLPADEIFDEADGTHLADMIEALGFIVRRANR
jgi:hypothetical protein